MHLHVLLLALVLAGAGTVRAGPPIPVSCGETIIAPGSYALAASCTCTGNGACIKVTADGVTLTLDDKTINCAPTQPPPAANDTTYGVQASDVRDFTLIGSDPSTPSSEGRITGCYMGLQAGNSKKVFVDSVDFSGNTYVGVNTAFSTDVSLNSNVVDGIGGYIGRDRRNGYAIAFNGCGTRCAMTSNIVRNIRTQKDAVKGARGEGVGIVVPAGAKAVVISYNWLESENEDSRAIGIHLSDGASAKIENNTITGFWQAITGTGAMTVTNNRLVRHKLSAYADSFAIFSEDQASGCASRNVIVRYRGALGPAIRDCGRNLVVR